MVWAGFSAKGKTTLAILKGNQKATDYVATLSNHLLPFGRRLGGPKWVFQQDNASIHTAKDVTKFFKDQNMAVMPWPARSPDLNPIENLWGILVRCVYFDGNGSFRQFETVEQLTTTLLASWDEISTSTCENLINSMPNRIFQLIKVDGKSTKY